jgi:hypothetical protein
MYNFSLKFIYMCYRMTYYTHHIVYCYTTCVLVSIM